MRRPMLLGHRGVKGKLENTFPAFKRALLYADGIEFDIRSTGDGRLVVHHDAAFRSNGMEYTLRDLTMEEVRKLHPSGKIIPTAEETFKKFPKVLLNADIKETYTVEPTIRVAEKTKSVERTVFSSESPRIVQMLLKECPDCKVGFSIVGYASPIWVPKLKGLYSIHVPIDAVSYIGYQPLVIVLKTLRKRGIRIYLWNYAMEELYWIPKFLPFIDAVISDDPARLRKVFTDLGGKIWG